MFRPLVALAMLLVLAAPARAEWVRLETPNFVFFSEAGERRTRDVARQFERFREALARAVPGAAARVATPTLVFLFEDGRSMSSYRPLYNGKPVDVSGYFAGDGTISTIMLSAADREQALRTIFHEYSHLVTYNVARGLPVWVSEGLAEYYSTFDVRADGRSAVMGGLIAPHLRLLQTERLLPIDQLLAVTHDSPLYNEGSRRSVFYAQSWALVHLLLDGEPDRRAPFQQYLQRTNLGEPAVDTWRSIFRATNIVRELDQYVRQAMMKGFEYKFGTEIGETTYALSKPAPAEVHGALAELRRLVTPEQVLKHLEATPGGRSAHGDVVRGLLMIRDDKDDEALPLLTGALERTADWVVRYRAAVGLERLATARDSQGSRTAAKAGLAAVTDVLREKPQLAHALAMKSILLGSTDDGLAAIAQARQLAPGREQYAMYHAQLLVDRGNFAEARKILGPLLSPVYPKDVRDHVRTLLAHSVAAEKARTGSAGRPSSETLAPNRDGLAPPLSGGGIQYVFRKLEPGEERIEGVLEQIACPRTGPVIHVRTADRAWTFSVADLDKVDFITYTPREGGIGCGPRPANERVYLTYRPSQKPSEHDGIAVAVEFLPVTVR